MESARASCAVLLLDVAGSTALHRALGDAEAGRRIGALIAAASQAVQQHHGEVIKADGDDLLAVFGRGLSATADAADAAIAAQRIAAQAGLCLHAGLHAGEVLWGETLGRRDVSGLAVNFAARLHKLTPDVPGRIFLAELTARLLPAELQERLRPFGRRELKGIGPADLFTLDWDEHLTCIPTEYVGAATAAAPALLLRHTAQARRLQAGDPPLMLGRSRSHCGIVIEDALVSSRHAQVRHERGQWWLRDVSRNGTWLRGGTDTDARELHGAEALLPRRGAICLGRSFARNQDADCMIAFEIAES